MAHPFPSLILLHHRPRSNIKTCWKHLLGDYLCIIAQVPICDNGLVEVLTISSWTFWDRPTGIYLWSSSGHILLCSVRRDWSLDGLVISYGLALSESTRRFFIVGSYLDCYLIMRVTFRHTSTSSDRLGSHACLYLLSWIPRYYSCCGRSRRNESLASSWWMFPFWSANWIARDLWGWVTTASRSVSRKERFAFLGGVQLMVTLLIVLR
jgi:hypothetical protein